MKQTLFGEGYNHNERFSNERVYHRISERDVAKKKQG